MQATSGHKFVRLCILAYFFLLLRTYTRVAGRMAITSPHPGIFALEQTRRNRPTKPKNPYHKNLAERQTRDQNLQFMLNLYRKAADSQGRPREHKFFGSNTVRLLRAFSTRRDFLSPRDLQYIYRMEYELENLPLDKLVRASFVHLRSHRAHPLPVVCEARISSSNQTGHIGYPLSDRVILDPESHWTESDITPHLSQWKGGRLSLTAQYKCIGSGWVRLTSGHRTRAKRHLRPPALLLFLEEEEEGEGHPMKWTGGSQNAEAPQRPRSRSRRSKETGSIVSDIPNYKRGKNGVVKNQCKLHSYRVAFSDLGWDHWIIAPHKYNPRYCMGDCPRLLHYGLNSPNHAIVQTFINELGVADIPLPSCVPHKYKPISVLMMEKNGNIVYKEYEDMIAESCTCR
ncbi:bone morphogenetic protein 15 [Chanos chanos]|uniref:Bone morphogenetic protein 15 n=1 Tax=Chanos chanos TaxID=29144 RepID=A0A6J2VX10_CHACN|nr:bone morphogenetic protein 15-like [Chanos chanos]